jgi:hypothetical protein
MSRPKSVTKGWPPSTVLVVRNSLESLKDGIGARASDLLTDEVIWLTRFLVIRTCGYLEQVVYETMREYVVQKSFGLVKVFASSWLERTKNPSPENLLLLVGRFDRDLSLDLEQLLDQDDQYLRRELSYLVDRRNKIAHGLNESVNLAKALNLVKVAETLAEWFVANFHPK